MAEKKVETILNIVSIFLFVIKNYTAGNPMNSDIKWTNLKCSQIRDILKEKAIDAVVHVVKQLLKMCGFVKRKMVKTNSLKETKNKNDQFEYIAALKEKYISKASDEFLNLMPVEFDEFLPKWNYSFIPNLL